MKKATKQPIKRSLKEWLAWQEELHLSEIDLGLDRIRKVAKNLNLLSPSFPIITVAGTNGKGSCVAMLDAILRAQGYKVGNYTSPHLIEYNERIKLDGENASDEQIINAFEAIDKARFSASHNNDSDNKISLTYFEFGTLAAMHCFETEKVDVAILEVGLGGRLDAANLWDASLALITSIDIDHTSWLGNDRELIGIEKAGIMRSGVAAVCGDPMPPKSIKSEAQRIGSVLLQLNKDFSYKVDPDDHEKWIWKNQESTLNLPRPNLEGEFQLNNAATVIAGLFSIKKLLPITQGAISKGLSKASAMGRLQTISTSPEWLLDVAHNPHAAKELAKYLQDKPISGKTYALFSMLKDKDIKQVISIMNQSIDEWHLVPLGGSRGMTINELNHEIKQQSLNGKVICHDSFADAYQDIRNIINFKDRVVAFGSFLVVSETLEINKQIKGASKGHG